MEDTFTLNFSTSVLPLKSTSNQLKRKASEIKGNWKKKRNFIKNQNDSKFHYSNTNTSLNESSFGKNSEELGNNGVKLDAIKHKFENSAVVTKPSINQKNNLSVPHIPDAKPSYVSSSIFTSNPAIPSVSKPVETEKNTQKTEDLSVFSKVNSFEEMNINPLLVKHLHSKLSIKKPTKIQSFALPVLLQNSARDILINAQTGSGKTLTFLLPIIHRILKAAEEMDDSVACEVLCRKIGCLAIVLAPTRELARQIYTNLNLYLQFSHAGIRSTERDKKDESSDDESSKHSNLPSNVQEKKFKAHWIVPGLVVGGEKKKSEKARLRKGINILVSTPGRLLDHLQTTQCFEAANLRWLVFDEADRLLELGFKQPLTEIIAILDAKRNERLKKGVLASNRRLKIINWPKDRQIILCSATLGAEVRQLAETTLNDPIMINQDKLNETKKKVEKTVIKEKVDQKAFVNIQPQSQNTDDMAGKEIVNAPLEALPNPTDKTKFISNSVILEKGDDFNTADCTNNGEENGIAEETNIPNKNDKVNVTKWDDEELQTNSQIMDIDGKTVSEAAKVENAKFNIPPQIKQSYVVVPAKQRLVAIISLLRHLACQEKPCKIMVFISSCDSVDFYYRLFNEGGKRFKAVIDDEDKLNFDFDNFKNIKTDFIGESETEEEEDLYEDDDEERQNNFIIEKKKGVESGGELPRPIIPFVQILKLHGDLPQTERMKVTETFTRSESSILLCTDVVARGLDVPDVTHIIQFDPPTDINDYAHRVGRTARLGKEGEALIFLLPSEFPFLEILATFNVKNLNAITAEQLFKWLVTDKEMKEGRVDKNIIGGLNGVIEFDKEVIVNGKKQKKRKHVEVVATDLHMMLERYVLSHEDMHQLARSAYSSFVRSYATHQQTHNQIFHLKKLHLGHVAKCFGLREAPSGVGFAKTKQILNEKKKIKAQEKKDGQFGYAAFKRKSDILLSQSANEFSDGNVKKLNKERVGFVKNPATSVKVKPSIGGYSNKTLKINRDFGERSKHSERKSFSTGFSKGVAGRGMAGRGRSNLTKKMTGR
ncbi:ATP-dependent RNA helicase dbp7 [Lobulomyces angularis]|nr:ATP-dependent RNA helicase dbp7 [Lobulomyces angularis]